MMQLDVGYYVIIQKGLSDVYRHLEKMAMTNDEIIIPKMVTPL